MPNRKSMPIHKRFPGQHVMRSSIWLPDEKEPTKYSHRIGFEGFVHPVVANAVLALQIHSGSIPPVMLEQLRVMTEALKALSQEGACQRILRFGKQGLFSIAEDFSRFPAGRVKADGPHSGERLREVIVQRLREGSLTINFDGTMGYGSSFLQGAFMGLRKEADVSQLSLACSDTSIVTEVWSYINSAE